MKKISALVLSILVLNHVSVRAADAIIISEFMAANNLSLVDENGNHEDWIEIMNIGESPVNLAGWALTDDPSRPMQWVFPATNLAPNQTMVIFASGKNRLQPGLPLHTNFKLSNNGEYLALVRPDGSVAMQFAPAFPRQVADVSYGVAMESAQVGLLGQGSPAKVLVPTDDSNSTNWIRLDYDDSSWTTVTNGLGFAWQQRLGFANRDSSRVASGNRPAASKSQSCSRRLCPALCNRQLMLAACLPMVLFEYASALCNKCHIDSGQRPANRWRQLLSCCRQHRRRHNQRSRQHLCPTGCA